jgi:hypothetical protein
VIDLNATNLNLQAEREDLSNPSAIIARRQRQERDRKRLVFFCIGESESQAWISLFTIKPLRDKYGLKWLRVSMSYLKLSNLSRREVQQWSPEQSHERNNWRWDIPVSMFKSSLGWGTRGRSDSSVPLTAKCPKCLTLVN